LFINFILGFLSLYLIKKYDLLSDKLPFNINLIFSKITDMIIILDNNKNIVKINKKVSEILNYEEKELIGKQLDIVIENKEDYNDKATKLLNKSMLFCLCNLNFLDKEKLLPEKKEETEAEDKNLSETEPQTPLPELLRKEKEIEKHKDAEEDPNDFELLSEYGKPKDDSTISDEEIFEKILKDFAAIKLI